MSVGLNGQSFDVAGIHPHAPDDSRFLVRAPNGGHFTAVGAVGKLLVMIAYGVQDSQIVGGPGWFADEKWDVEAKSDDARHSADETCRMLRKLLEERFSLKIHRDTEQRSVYILKLAKGGPRFRLSERNTTNLLVGSNAIDLQRGSIARLAGVLATAVGRPVLDRTALTGLYDLSITWDDAPVSQGGMPGIAVSPAPGGSTGSDRGSIFTALRDQLGLRLEPRREPVEVIVVDGMERPSAN
jgi:uncharacterized protein (TIGR03435 family)